MHPNQIPVPNTDYRLEEFGDELLLYHPSATRTIYLNQTAALIWKLCDGTRSVAEVLALLRDSYPESAETIESDVQSALEDFVKNGAIHFERVAT